MKTFFFSIFLWISCSQERLFSQEKQLVVFDSKVEFDDLDLFFRKECFDECYGYVLEGAKPMCARGFYYLDLFPISSNWEYSKEEFHHSLLLSRALPLWKKHLQKNRKFALRAYDQFNEKLEVLFVNIETLRGVITENLALFRYCLGPLLEVDQLVEEIAYGNRSLEEILQHDLVLIGIVLGFGPENSLVVGRRDSIYRGYVAKERLPFNSNLHKLGFPPDYLGGYYLAYAGGDLTIPLDSSGVTLKRLSHTSFVEEVEKLNQIIEAVPSHFLKKPMLICGVDSRSQEKSRFFANYEKSQDSIRSALKRDDFLEQVIEKITTCRPLCSFLPEEGPKRESQNLLKSVLKRVTHTEAFLSSFFFSEEGVVPSYFGATPQMIAGAKIALQRLKEGEEYLQSLQKDRSFQWVIADKIGYQTLKKGVGEPFEGVGFAKLSFTISNVKGKVVAAGCEEWVELSQVVPGFLQGVQGMKLGEIRKVIVHPSYILGFFTTTHIGEPLWIEVEFLGEKGERKPLEPLSPVSTDWVSPLWIDKLEASSKLLPKFTGQFYREVFSCHHLQVEE